MTTNIIMITIMYWPCTLERFIVTFWHSCQQIIISHEILSSHFHHFFIPGSKMIKTVTRPIWNRIIKKLKKKKEQTKYLQTIQYHDHHDNHDKIIAIITIMCDDHKHDNHSNNPRTKLSSVIGRSLTGRITPTKVKLQKRPVNHCIGDEQWNVLLLKEFIDFQNWTYSNVLILA